MAEQQQQKTEKAPTTQRSTFVKSAARIEVLIGGPYKQNGEEHPYGHAALRVVTPESDSTYDYGRYGKVWGKFDSEGEGILRVWTNFSKYIAGENATGRTTTGFAFKATTTETKAVNDYFNGLIVGSKPTQDRGYMKQYKIKSAYHALNSNCTTLTIDGAKQAFPAFASDAASFNVGNGMGNGEKLVARWEGWPKRLFMPADLKNYISSLKGDSAPYETKTYSGKSN
ncbi:hypothetical protein ACN28S_11480 [Cystobacter fuscus]